MPQENSARWEAKPKGFKTVRRGKYWYKPGDLPTSPAAARAAKRKERERKVNRIPPPQFTGSEGLRGPFTDTPRLNPDEWEIGRNAKTSRWWARPANELTGLDPWMRRDVKGFDRRTDAQVGQITGAYENYANLASQDAAAGAANLGTLARAGAVGYVDSVAGSAAGPYGSVAPAHLSQAERALPGVLSLGAGEQSAAQSAQTIAGLNQLPTVARSEGGTVGASYRGEREDARREQLVGYRGQQQKAAEADSQARFQRQQLEATMRIALGEQANTRRGQTLDFKSQAADRGANLAAEAARLRQEAQIAKDNNRLERWKTLIGRAEKKEEAAKKARAKTTVNKKVREQADRLVDQMAAGIEDPDAPGGRIDFTREDIIDALIEEFDFSPSLAKRYASRGTMRSAGSFFG